MMTQTVLQDESSSAQMGKLYVAMELGGGRWKLVMGSRQRRRATEKTVAAGDLEGVLRAIAGAKVRHGLAPEAAVMSCYEAGRDGFWLHRELVRYGIESLVVDSSSIEVSRRARRAKTDRLDAHKLQEMLQRHDSGEQKPWHVVNVPSIEQEDARRLHRELERLKKERTAHGNRIRSLLIVHGIRISAMGEIVRELAKLRLRDGTELPAGARTEIEREIERCKLVGEQIRAIEGERRERVKREQTTVGVQVRHLMRLRGMAETGAWLLSQEVFAWRKFRNRRQAGALIGLTPTPYASDGSSREQGISKAGIRRVRPLMVQLAWGWLRYQPRSELSRWFQKRFGHGAGRMRRIGIIALARRLFIALWRFADQGVVPAGAELKCA